VATIANVTVLLVSLNFSGFGIADYVWTVIVLGGVAREPLERVGVR
jgi:hypothetical protein